MLSQNDVEKLILLFQNREGSWIGALVEKATHFFFYQMNYYTAILVSDVNLIEVVQKQCLEDHFLR